MPSRPNCYHTVLYQLTVAKQKPTFHGMQLSASGQGPPPGGPNYRTIPRETDLFQKQAAHHAAQLGTWTWSWWP